MRVTFTLIFINLQLVAFGQGYIIMNDGQKIRFNKFKEHENSLVVKEPGKKEKTEIKISNVKGYFYDYEERFFYTKPVTEKPGEVTYQFLKRVQSGAINLYEKEVEYITSAPTANGSGVPVKATSIHLLIEKSNRIEPIWIVDAMFQDKKDKLEILKSMLADDTLLMRAMNDDFKLTHKSLLNLISDYNVAKHTKEEEKGDGVNFGTLIFFRTGKNLATNLADRIKYGKTSDDDIRIAICDSTYILKNYDCIKIRVPAENHLKICFDESNSQCKIISTNSYLPTRFEVLQDKNSKLITLDLKDIEADSEIEKLKGYKPNKKRK